MTSTADNSQQAVALIKFFSEEKHYLAFKDGCSFFRTPHYFRKREDVGRGDRSESCLGYWDTERGDQMPNLVRNGEPIDIENAKSVLIYPAHEQQDSWLQSWCVIGPHNEFEQSLERMLEEFGTYFVVLPAKHIITYANLVGQASGDKVRYGLVQYSDNPLDRSLTVKDSKFSYQKEFRFYVGQCEKDEIQDKELRLQGVNNVLLEAGTLKLESPSGVVRYCSQGRKEVVLA
ncbi:hypothetical protein VCB98_13765 [Gammaproteobacteria bacterium AB-CW1]|uniref:Uncharacterized protein n=1 Tax=Natronospira elongata TaxID=3110268 RepID=A0AAP6JH08_9GAMM|nr:hypothetical protein [Gammaproteobacteria bacterium AB-CW1]